MRELENLEFDARVFRRKAGPPNSAGKCVVYWMQRSQRARDNPALNVAIDAANLLRKPVVVYFQILPRAVRANWRHYEFMRSGLEQLPAGLAERNVHYVLGGYPQDSILRFCAETHPVLVPTSWNCQISGATLR